MNNHSWVINVFDNIDFRRSKVLSFVVSGNPYTEDNKKILDTYIEYKLKSHFEIDEIELNSFDIEINDVESYDFDTLKYIVHGIRGN
jgi:hypothetical protein